MTPVTLPAERPLVSVAIPTYNRAHVLAECLDSVLAQTYRPLEVVVADDGSSDHTAKVVAAYGDRVVYVRQENRGISAARNLAARVARGSYIAWMDSDDVCLPDRIAVEVALLAARPDVAMISSDFEAFDARGTISRSYIRQYYSIVNRTPSGFAGIYSDVQEVRLADDLRSAALPETVRVYSGMIHEQLVWGSPIHPPTVLLRRDVAEEVGELDERLPTSMEYEYLIRMSRRARMAYVDVPLLRYRLSSEQISSDRHAVLTRRAILEIVERVGREEEPFVRLNARRFRQRLGACHAALAAELAASDPREARQHLVEALRNRFVDRRWVAGAAMSVLPPGWTNLVRGALRRARGGASR